MTLVTPFRAYVPSRESAALVSCPPYDVVDFEQARRIAGTHPDNFMRVVRSDAEFGPDADPHAEAVYDRARDNLRALIERGVLTRTESAWFVYRLEREDRAQTGLIGAASLAAYKSGAIKRHELTRPDKENDRTRHIAVTGANTGLIYLAFRATHNIKASLSAASAGPADIAFTAGDGVAHAVWIVPAGAAHDALTEAFAGVETMYVADGHHRIAASTRHWTDAGAPEGPASRAMAAVFPHDELLILPYHRVVRDWGEGRTAADVLAAVGESFAVTPTEQAAPERPGTFGLFLDGRWYRIEAREPADGPVERRLDVAVLQDRLLAPVLGIDNPRTDPRIEFVGGVHGTAELERRAASFPRGLALACYATAMDDLLAVADAGAVMPPKSTWFEPKLRSGLVVRVIEEA